MHDYVDHAVLASHAAIRSTCRPRQHASAASRSPTYALGSRRTSPPTPTTTWSRCAASGSSPSTRPSRAPAGPTLTSPPTSRPPASAACHAPEAGLLDWLKERCIEVYGKTKVAEDFVISRHAVGITMRGTGLKIDVAPVLYEDEPDDRGHLITRDGERVLTSVTLHLRVPQHPQGRTPVPSTRSSSAWSRRSSSTPSSTTTNLQVQELPRRAPRRPPVGQRLERRALRDQGLPARVRAVLRLHRTDRTARGRSRSPTTTAPADVAASTDPIRVWDPVNPANNVAAAYNESDRIRLVQRAAEALDSDHLGGDRQHQGRRQRRLAHHLRPDLPGSVT